MKKNRKKPLLALLLLASHLFASPALVFAQVPPDKEPALDFLTEASDVQWDFEDLSDHTTALASVGEQVAELQQAMLETLPEDFVCSPLSFYLALAALEAGLKGESKEQVAKVLQPEGLSDEEYASSLQGVPALGGLDRGVEAEEDFRPWISDTLAIGAENQEFHFAEEFLEALQNRGMRAALADLSQEEAWQALNDLTKEETKGLIDPLFEDEQIAELVANPMLLLLMNIIYFKGNWTNPFPESATEEEPFYGEKEESRVFLMKQRADFLYLETDDYQAVRLPYETGGQMIVLLPKEDVDQPESMAMLEEARTSQAWEDYDLTLALPVFEQTATLSLLDTLESLNLAFLKEGIPAEDLAATSQAEEMAVSEILQKVKIKVDEEGSEAAAATVIMVMDATAMREEKPHAEMKVNRPFVYMIEDFGLPLFIGSVRNLP